MSAFPLLYLVILTYLILTGVYLSVMVVSTIKPLFNFAFNNSLNQLIAEPTHSNGNILDLLLCNYFSSNILISYCIDMPFCSSCDHSSIYFHLKWTVKTNTTKPKCHNFQKAKYKVICEVLSCINWNSVLESSGDCVQTLYDHILEILSQTIQSYVPLEYSSESIRKPSQLSKLLKEKLSLYQKSKNDFSLVSDYKAKSKEYDQCVKKWYTDVETLICNNLTNAKFYSYIGIIKVYVRKLFKLKNDGKKNMKLTQIPFDYCCFLKIFVPLVFFFILVFKGGSWVSFTKKNYL